MELEDLSSFERLVLTVIFNVNGDRISFDTKELLSKLKVSARSKDKFGFYVDFFSGDGLRSKDANGNDLDHAFELCVKHPNNVDSIFFILYVCDGKLCFLEGSSSGEWPERDDEIEFEHAMTPSR